VAVAGIPNQRILVVVFGLRFDLLTSVLAVPAGFLAGGSQWDESDAQASDRLGSHGSRLNTGIGYSRPTLSQVPPA
jgi:hypothetical protein